MEDNNFLENAMKERESLGTVKSPQVSEREKMMQERDKLIEEKMSMTRMVPQSNQIRHTPRGYINLTLEELPSLGRFYPSGIKLQIRPADIKSIEHYSIMAENDPIDIRMHIIDLLKDNMICTVFNQPYAVEDILEADKVYILLAIYELTFPNAENQIILNSTCPKCGVSHETILSRKILDMKTSSSERIEAYYDVESRSYKIKTKSYGEFHLSPPKMGVSIKLLNQFRQSKIANQFVDESFYTILPYIYQGTTSDLTENKLIELYDKYQDDISMSNNPAARYSLIYRLIEQINLGLELSITKKCDDVKCNSYQFPFNIPGGWKSLFVILDPFSELI